MTPGRSSTILHNDRDEFLKMLERTSGQTGFSLGLLEKDYYMTILLAGIDGLGGGLIFKGGTCLNKIYYSYYRLSEDLDFSMKLPAGDLTRTVRSNLMKPIKGKIGKFGEDRGMTVETMENTGHRMSTQYVFRIVYESVVAGAAQAIKLEIGLRFNPIMPVSKMKIRHRFLHPFTKEPLFDGGTVKCLSLKELVAEKLRAAATRPVLAPRDIYDLGYIYRAGFDFDDPELWRLFGKKLEEDGFERDLTKYRSNLGRSEKEIENMRGRIESELLDVLTLKEKTMFDLDGALKSINTALGNME